MTWSSVSYFKPSAQKFEQVWTSQVWTSQVFGFEKALLFYQEICFSFFTNGYVNFRKMLLYMKRQSFYKINLESFKLPRSVFSKLEISMVLMDFFVVSFKWNLIFELPWQVGMVLQ